MFGQDRQQLRKFYRDAWQKRRDGRPLTALEDLVSAVVAMHPEYHAMLEGPEETLEHDFGPEAGQSNPFLHMGLHIALHEQLQTRRPPELETAYRGLLTKGADPHDAEHRLMECLAEMLWEAQRSGMPPSEEGYRSCLRRLFS